MNQINTQSNDSRPLAEGVITIDNTKFVPLDTRKRRITKVQANDFRNWFLANTELRNMSSKQIAKRYRTFSGISVSQSFIVNCKHALFGSSDDEE